MSALLPICLLVGIIVGVPLAWLWLVEVPKAQPLADKGVRW